jgi:hypothetical protein
LRARENREVKKHWKNQCETRVEFLRATRDTSRATRTRIARTFARCATTPPRLRKVRATCKKMGCTIFKNS